MKITKKVLLKLYYIFCLGGSFVLGLLLLYFDVLHYHFWFQWIPAFFVFFGFIGCAILILVAKAMGYWLEKREGHYERRYTR